MARPEQSARPRRADGEIALLQSIERAATEQRISFIVRITRDEHGQPCRTEIEHALSGNKSSFPAFDAERLGIFILQCLNPDSRAQPALPLGTRESIPKTTDSGRDLKLVILQVSAARLEAPDLAVLILTPQERFLIQIDFEIQGSDALAACNEQCPYQVKVCAHPVTGGPFQELVAMRAKLAPGTLQYTVRAKASGVLSGTYRLITRIRLDSSPSVAGYHTQMAVQVGEE